MLFRKSCDGGISTACYDLAMRSQIGNGVPKDLNQATAWFKKACDGGEARACEKIKRR